MGTFGSDLRYGLRMLRRTPLMSLLAALTIGLGIGLTTFTFSIVYATLLRGLPIPDSDKLLVLQETDLENGIEGMSVPIHDFLAFREQSTTFADLDTFYSGTVNVGGDGEPPERYQGGFVSATLLQLSGISPLLGRTFAEGEDLPGAPPATVLGYDIWRNRFASDPGVIGTTLRANGEAFTIIGVMPEGFRFPFNEDLWVTNRTDPESLPRRGGRRLQVLGRPREGVALDAVNAEVAAIAARLEREFPEVSEGIGARVIRYQEDLPDVIPPMLWLMLAAVLGVLLVACANVANLLLARATVREREVAIRTALGASRLQVIRQLLAEALVLSVGGGLVGLALAPIGINWFNLLILGIEKPYWIVMRLDEGALAFAAGATIIAALAAGTVPAFRASGGQVGSVLRDESRGSSSLRLGRFSSGLVVAELALSCGLMIGAGLLVRTVLDLNTMEMGFAVDNVMTTRLGLFESDYPEHSDRDRFYHELLDRLRTEPGVQAATLASALPAAGGSWAVGVQGEEYATDAEYPRVAGSQVTPGYFETFEIPILQGRDFLSAEWQIGAEPVAIVSAGFVSRYLDDGNGLGRLVRLGTSQSSNPWMRIVGVVPDVHEGVGFFGTGQVPAEHVYVPLTTYDPRFVSLAVRTPGNPASIVPQLRSAVAAVDPELPLYWVRTMDEALYQNRTFLYEILGQLFAIFGVAALFLASVGLYGVIDFSVSRRRQEMGVRMALGADSPGLIRLVYGKVFLQLGIGLTIGVALGAALGVPLGSLLYGVDPTDPVVYATIVAVFVLTGIVAAFFPARRATAVDPAVALRPD